MRDSFDWFMRRVILQAAADGVLAQPTTFARRVGLSWHTLNSLLRNPARAHANSLIKLVEGLGFNADDRQFLMTAGVHGAEAALRQRRREARGDRRQIRAAGIHRKGLWLPSATTVPSSAAAPENTPPDTERLAWIYMVGATGSGDLVLERRVTRAPDGGLHARIVGPGVNGRDAFLDHPAVLGLEAVVEVVDSDVLNMPRVADLTNLHLNPVRANEEATDHFARVRLTSFSPEKARVCVEFVPSVPAGSWVQWTLLYRWPKVWESARQRLDDMFSLGFNNFGDADEGAVVFIVAPRSKDGDASVEHATGRLHAVLEVGVARRASDSTIDRNHGAHHVLGWRAARPGRVALELRFVDRGRIPSTR